MENYEQKYKEALKKGRKIHRFSSNPTVIKNMEDIFPELKESEDEKIRKDCIKYLNWEYQACSINEDKMKIEKCVSWLEKQGNISLTGDELEALRIAAYEPTKNWSDKLQSLYEKLTNYDQGEQKSAWSEEDEWHINNIISLLEQARDRFVKESDGQYPAWITDIIWFKSIKDRVQPQSTKEWSKEDKENLLDIKCLVDEVWHRQDIREKIGWSVEELERLWNWLDTLWQRLEYPQNRWKPSEEQILALEYAMAYVSKKEDFSVHETIESLYIDLKKL